MTMPRKAAAVLARVTLSGNVKLTGRPEILKAKFERQSFGEGQQESSPENQPIPETKRECQPLDQAPKGTIQ